MIKDKVWQALADEQLIDSIQIRPGMYIGALGMAGLETMITQVIDGLVQLLQTPDSAEIQIELFEDQLIFSLSSPKDAIITKEAAGYPSLYNFLSIIYALSEEMGISIDAEGQKDFRIYQNQKLIKQAQVSSTESLCRLEIAFKPMKRVFGYKNISYFVLFNRCQQLAMLNSGVKFILREGETQKNTLCYPQGLLEYIFQKDDSITRGSRPLVINTVKDDVKIQAVISKNGSTQIADSFVNWHYPADGGTHFDGFVQGAVEAMNQFLKETNRLQYFTVDNFSERFDFVLSIKVARPRYTGAIKKKIRNPELYKILREVTYQEVTTFLKRHPSWYVN